ncbi:HK97 gp10 family phage protein [Comamonas odontotermitis]|uniref:HK97 gp10 family phage protein n=1 Tax=Comamonas odontotermitis TaxID=379895 RepID=UPI001CC67B10|nr:HK97 gp10 family phage protein [Comamonas odontotermitis]UBB16136.1 HK97 gp10 family phage protein [Comamonas odontotermitis]
MARRTLSTKGGNGRSKVLKGNSSFGIDADLGGMFDGLDALEEDIEQAIRPAAQAGAQVLYDRVKLNVSTMGRVTGNLDRSIYQAYSPENSVEGLRVEYHVSWNHKKAPHGHLLEFGWMQRYRMRPDGMGPMVRPGMDGTKKPGRRASQAEKDAYYVPLPTPKQIPGFAFVRSASSSITAAQDAARDELWRRLGLKG